MAAEQEQFLDVLDRDEAFRRWRNAIEPRALPAETVPVDAALGRVLACDVCSGHDVPGFDRSNVDGFAVIAADTFGATDIEPLTLALNDEAIATGHAPSAEVTPGTASPIATGGMIPRGADAVLMVEHVRVIGESLVVQRPVAPGAHISHAGSDIARGELVCLAGTLLTSRETGLLAAVGIDRVAVVRKPLVAVISTGDELIAPGASEGPGLVYDANARLLADAVREQGGQPVPLGIVPDDADALNDKLDAALAGCDLVLLSGGTSKGGGDLSYRTLSSRSPGILVHGVALKPGKPVCLGMAGATPVAILPGFPTSAIFTFHEFVAPVIRRMAGLDEEAAATRTARMAARANSERGRTEFLLVGLTDGPDGPAAWPMGKGSGSVTTFSRADGFVVIPKHQEYVDAGEPVEVTLIGRDSKPADLVIIGSHCIGLDTIISALARRGVKSKSLWVGSQGGLDAVRRGECDIAGAHLLDPVTDKYNRPFLPPDSHLLYGYARMQGFVHRTGDPKFAGLNFENALSVALGDPACRMVSRNRGSGTRVIIEGILAGAKPPGYTVEVRSHHAVAAAIVQKRADWGITIEPVARHYGLSFHPIRWEEYDFAVPQSRVDSKSVGAFRDALRSDEMRQRLESMGFRIRSETGTWAE